MKIHQSAFIQDLVIEERLTDCNANIIPINTGLSIEISNSEDYEETNLHTYQRLVGKLMYLSYNIRLDISFVVDQLSRHNANLRKKHLQAAKKVVKYLKETIKMGLIFGQESAEQLPRNSSPYRLISYTDNNFAGDLKDQKSVIGYYFFLNRAMVS